MKTLLTGQLSALEMLMALSFAIGRLEMAAFKVGRDTDSLAEYADSERPLLSQRAFKSIAGSAVGFARIPASCRFR